VIRVLLGTVPVELRAVPAEEVAVAGVVSRPGLFQRLTQAQRVVQVSAPAGSGKTVLLRSWIAESGLAGQAAWLPVPGDSERFWISVVSALRDTAIGSAQVRTLTAAPDLDGWTVVERLLEDLASFDVRVWLVIDDLQELSSEEVLRQLELLIMRAPPALRFVLLTRHDLRLGLHRLRLSGELTELRAADLRFSRADARALLDAAGVPLSDSAFALLYDRTEGWAAGLRLAALSLAGHPDPERFAAEFGGSERTVAEYLLAEVLERQPAGARRLLLRTSILERVNGELADLLTGEPGGERVLQRLEDAGAFVVALDARRSWYRYHQLFADLLQLELRGSEPEALPALHEAAASWYAEHGYPVQAIRHAQAAQDWGLATRVLSDNWIGLGLAGLGGTAGELFGRFPAAVIAADAELAAGMAGYQLFRGSLEEAGRYLALSARTLESVPADRRGHCEVILAAVRMRLARQRGDIAGAVEQAELLLVPAVNGGSVQPEVSGDLRALALVNLGIAELWTSRFDEADRHLEDGIALAHEIGRPFLEVTGLAYWAQLMSWRSFPLGAQQSLQAIELAARHGWADEPVVGYAYLALGVAMVTQGRIEDAERALGRAERTVRTEVDPAVGMRLRYGRGMLEFVCGRVDAAVRAFEAAERLSDSLVTPHTLAPRLRSHLLQALVRMGETGRVEQALAGMDGPERERGEIRIAETSLRIAQDDPKAAAAVLAPVLDGSAPLQNAHLWEVQAHLLQAIACEASGDPVGARRALERALDLAEPECLVFPFLYDPAPELLDRQRRHGTAHGQLIGQILNVLAGQEPGAQPSGPPRLREPLSHAEARVLRYLPTKLSAPEIADEMYLSVNTVKTHMRHVYDKLGAHRRHEAVEQARALGLLAPSSRRQTEPAAQANHPAV
jgi:LuxR family transcriptional regulator, maltose regulon positive regulatory protein